MTHIIVDLANIFWRSRHAIKGNTDIKLGMSFHVIFNSVKKAWNDFNGSHLVFCLEGYSWRKKVYAPYKLNREELKQSMTMNEQEEHEIFLEAQNEFIKFITNKTNCTVLHHPELEADDLIAGWVQHHSDIDHVIISTDSDFVQLISNNVKQYNGVSDTLVTIDGFFDGKGNRILNKRSKAFIDTMDIEWLLFEKCMRGDVSDNIFSAYPGVRTKGSKNRSGLIEAFEDRKTQGFVWNNLMLQRWVDHNGVEHIVMDDYKRNKMLIDLTNQPDHIKTIIKETIVKNAIPKQNQQVGINMLKFCALYDMVKVSDNIQQYAQQYQAKYNY